MTYWKRTVVSMVLILFAAGSLSAGTLMVGVKAWGAVWDSLVSGIITDIAEEGLSADPDSSVDAALGKGFLVGPVVGYQFSAAPWSVSLALMAYGLFTQETSLAAPTFSFEGTITQKLNRIDADIAVSRSLGSYFKVFAGYKFQRFTAVFDTSAGIGPIDDRQAIIHQPTIGCGIAYPFSERFTAGLQAGVLAAFADMDKLETEPSFGVNAEASFNFFVTPTWLLQGGYRFQLYHAKYKDQFDGSSRTYNDMFHGVTVGVVYLFHNL